MRQLNVGIDVDGTLIDWNEQPNQAIVDLIKFLSTHTKNVNVIVWSRRGETWAKQWVDALELGQYVRWVGDKNVPWDMDIAFDDQHEFDLATHNVIVRLK